MKAGWKELWQYRGVWRDPKERWWDDNNPPRENYIDEKPSRRRRLRRPATKERAREG